MLGYAIKPLTQRSCSFASPGSEQSAWPQDRYQRCTMAGDARKSRAVLNASFIPPKRLRELRLIARYHERVHSMQAAEKNRKPADIGRWRHTVIGGSLGSTR